MGKRALYQTRSRLNSLIEVPTIYGFPKLSLAGKGRCYYDFLNDIDHTIPLIFEIHEVITLGCFASFIRNSNAGQLFKLLMGYTQAHHPERVNDVLYLARMIWITKKQGADIVFDENVYLSIHEQLMELEDLYRLEHRFLKLVAEDSSSNK